MPSLAITGRMIGGRAVQDTQHLGLMNILWICRIDNNLYYKYLSYLPLKKIMTAMTMATTITEMATSTQL